MLPASTLAHLEWPAVCGELLRRIVSPAARERFCDASGHPLDERLLPRTTDPVLVTRRLDLLSGLEFALRRAQDFPDTKVSLAGELGDVVNTTSLLERAQRGSALDVAEIAAVTAAAVAASRAAHMFDGVADAGLERATALEQRCFSAFRAAFHELAPPAALVVQLAQSIELDAGEFRLADTASPVLGSLRAKATAARRALITAAERFIRRAGMDRALADRYWTEREGRVVVPVRSDAFSRAGGSGTITGIIHGSSSSGQTLFVEPPDLVDYGNGRREAAMAVVAEEERILARLSASIGESAPALLASLAALVELDRLQAVARLSAALRAEPPVVAVPVDGSAIRLPGARHPLMVLRGVDVVPNDIVLNVGQGLVISGPNAGGKTVALKTLGLCTLMAQAGLPLPTDRPANLPLFDAIVTDVGDDQSIAANLSTFSAHIGHVMDALREAQTDGPRVLVLLDEVAVGTDPDQGAALAEAILTALVRDGATLVVTTHYERLKILATDDPEHFINASVGFDLEHLRPTFRLRIGAPGSSSALAVARRLGMPEPVLRHAEVLLADQRVRVDALLQQIEAERERLHEENEALQKEWRTLKNERAAFEEKEKRAEASAAARRRKAHDAAVAALRGLEEELKERRKALRKSSDTRTDASGVTDPEARTLARDARGQIALHRLEDTQTVGAAIARLDVGSKVKVGSLGVEGAVVAIKGDKVTVQLPLAKVTVDRSELSAGTEAAKALRSGKRASQTSSAADGEVDRARYFGVDPYPVEARVDNVVDLRGVRAEEALALVEVGLDRALGDDADLVIVRHGHGSGALRRVVREHLPRLGHVHRFRSGLPSEGGDAVTIVWIR